FVGSEFFGWVPEAYLRKKPPTRDFGAFAMWDLPAFEIRDGRIYSRAIDDLMGCVTILAMLQELERTNVEASCRAIFTRAEEVGFVGAIQLAKTGKLPKDLTVISLETSSERGGPVKMGDGVIIRVGDRTGIFDPAASAALLSLARAQSIPHQRALMQGGTCEATAFQVYGYRTTGLCIALGNYHNCGPDETIASEYVSIDDAAGMVRLCVAAAAAEEIPDPLASLRQKYEQDCEKYRAYF
ncbi:MAG TPA: M20/M25/M40 family metallo-hydrolase, partial [Chthoniobacteraceae bacterium]